MAEPKTIKFGKSLIEIGDGATPTEVFNAPCGFEQIGMTVNTETNNNNLPDCADPDAPTWTTTDVVSKQMQLTGEGFFDADNWKDMWRAWFMDGTEKNVRFHVDLTSALGGGYFQGKALLTTFEFSGQRGQRGRISIGITFQGKPVWTPATP